MKKTTKKCYECKVVKSLVNFNRDKSRYDGMCHRCRECNREHSRLRRLKYHDKYIAREHKYYQRNKKVLLEKKLDYYKRNRHKIRAHQLVRSALITGAIKRIDKCQRCPNKSVNAHHEDYSKPLEVIWLCGSCHMKIHARPIQDRP